MPVQDKVRDVIARIDAVVGMAGAIGGYRREGPDERQEGQYIELASRIEDDLAQLREQTGAGLVNPNQHQSLRSFWAWGLRMAEIENARLLRGDSTNHSSSN